LPGSPGPAKSAARCWSRRSSSPLRPSPVSPPSFFVFSCLKTAFAPLSEVEQRRPLGGRNGLGRADAILADGPARDKGMQSRPRPGRERIRKEDTLMISTAEPTPVCSPPRRPAAGGPRGHWLLGCLPQFLRDPLGLYVRTNRGYGHYARIRAFPRLYVHLLTHPDAVEHVLVKHHKNYRKPDFFNQPVALLTGNGILTSEGDFWLRQRRLMQPAFHRQHLARLVPAMTGPAELFGRERKAAGPGEVVDMLDHMMKVTLRIAGTTLFGTDVTGEADEIGRAFRTGFAHVSRRMNAPPFVPTWLPTPGNLAFGRAKRLLDRVVLRLIAERRRSGSQPADLLSLLLAAQDEETGVAMTDQQVKNEVLTLLMAGHETMGARRAW